MLSGVHGAGAKQGAWGHSQKLFRVGVFVVLPQLLAYCGIETIAESSEVSNCTPGYMEQAPSRGYEASPQSGLGVGWELCSSSKKVA